MILIGIYLVAVGFLLLISWEFYKQYKKAKAKDKLKLKIICLSVIIVSILFFGAIRALNISDKLFPEYQQQYFEQSLHRNIGF